MTTEHIPLLPPAVASLAKLHRDATPERRSQIERCATESATQIANERTGSGAHDPVFSASHFMQSAVLHAVKMLEAPSDGFPENHADRPRFDQEIARLDSLVGDLMRVRLGEP
jgi:hypothetical protein